MFCTECQVRPNYDRRNGKLIGLKIVNETVLCYACAAKVGA